jgi:hypothetical protein
VQDGPTTPLGAGVVNSAIITGHGEAITRAARLYVGYRAYLPLITKAQPLLFMDDFSTDKGWINEISSHPLRDDRNE